MERPRDWNGPSGFTSPRGLALTAIGVAVVLVVTAAVLAGFGGAGPAAPGSSGPETATPTPVGTDGAGAPVGGTPVGTDAAEPPAVPIEGDARSPTPTPDAGSLVDESGEGSTGSDGDDGAGNGSAGDGSGSDGPGDGGSDDGAGSSGDDHGDDGGDDADAGGSAAADGDGEAHFVIRVQSIEECGQRCRDVTAAVENNGTATATNVTVDARVLADGDELWRGDAEVGDLPAGETATRTKRVTIGVFDAAKIQANGGYVTIELTVRWDGGEDTVTQRRKVI